MVEALDRAGGPGGGFGARGDANPPRRTWTPRAHHNFPYGDFERVHRCGVLAAESRAGQRKYHDIELAVADLHGTLDAVR